AVVIADRTRGHSRVVLGATNGAPLVLNETSRRFRAWSRRHFGRRGRRSRSRSGPTFRRVPAQSPHRRRNACSATGAAVTAIRLNINNAAVVDDVLPRLSLADFLREQRNLTGTHLGCEHGVCGACTVLV